MNTDPKTIKKAVLYTRVSTKEQVDEGNSLVTQERSSNEYALKNNFEVVRTFVEKGESAKTADRTELRKLLEFCAQKKNKISAVIVYKIDRLSRNTDDYSQLRLLLKRYDVEIKSTTEYFENTPAGRFMENIISNVAQFDNDVRAERCSNGMRDATREGRYVWMAPMGYSNVRVADKATIAPNDMAPLVRKAFELTATGAYTTDELWKSLSKEGLHKKNGTPVVKSYFYQMLRNELYAGWINKFGERHKGTFEPIVDEELFLQAQRVLKNKGHKTTQYKKDNADFPLRRFVFNPSGIKLTGSWSKGRGGKYAFYRFGSKGSNHQRDNFEKQFTQLMDSYRFDNEQLDKLKRLVRKAFHDVIANDRLEEKRLKNRLQELIKNQTALVQKNLKGVVSDAVLNRQLEVIDKEEVEIHSALALLNNISVSPEEAVDFAEKYLTQPSEIWKSADIETKTKLQWFQFPSGVTFDGEVFGTTKVSSVFNAKDALSASLSTTVDPSGFEPLTSSLQMRRSTS